MRGRTTAERFWSKVDLTEPGACWMWTAGVDRYGYGRFGLAGQVVGAHRFVYESLVGPIPPELELDHLCRTRACVNPAHLEPVTHRENVLRGVAPSARHAAKTYCSAGHPYDAKNTYVTPGGSRNCRACRRDAQRRYRERRGTAALDISLLMETTGAGP